MTLRLRLVVAFLALSVLPLGVVTFYTYTTSVEAMRNVAASEADLLASVLNQRMQVITSQLSDRIEHLIEITAPAPAETPAPSRTTTSASATRPASPAPASSAATTAMTDQEQMSHRVADALGEAAVLLNTVNVQGMGRFGLIPPRSGFSPGGTGTGRAGGEGANAASGTGPGSNTGRTTTYRSGEGGRRGSTGARTPPAGTTTGTSSGEPPPTPPPAPTAGAKPAESATPRPQAAPMAPPAPPTGPTGERLTAPGRPDGPRSSVSPTADPRVIVSTDDGMKIDLTQIRRDIYRQILPSTPAEQLTPEERQRIAHEVNQRMLGIVEGIKLSAAEIQKQADEARQKGDVAARKDSAAKGTVIRAVPPVSSQPSISAVPPPVPEPAPPAPAASAPAPQPAAPLAPLTRTATFSGNRLDVKFERSGQVVRTINAEINLPNMLMTVFSSTPREQGEVPFAVDKDGRVYAQSDAERARVEALGAVATPTGPLGKTVLPDYIVVTTAGPQGTGLRFGIARPTGDSLASLRRTAGRNVGFGLLFIVIALAGVVPISSRLTRNLTKLTEGVSRIAKGDYAARVGVKSHDEVGALAAAFNQMAADVERHQRAVVEQERIKRELELGRQIQHDMLPQGTLHHGLTEIKGVSVPAREVGGDFFNYFELSNGQIAMLVGDVSGKGVGAALLMANIQASLRTRLALGQDLAAVADEIDRDIAHNAPESLYATLYVGMFDPITRTLQYVNCGHHPQFVMHRSGGLERMASTGMPVGLLAGHGYRQVAVQLEAGDRLFFYTDGCVEAENEAGDFFGPDRLEAAILAGGDNPDDVLAHVERAVEAFRGGRELLDDVTVMAVRVG